MVLISIASLQLVLGLAALAGVGLTLVARGLIQELQYRQSQASDLARERLQEISAKRQPETTRPRV